MSRDSCEETADREGSTSIEADGCHLQTFPDHGSGAVVTIPVDVKLPAEVVEECLRVYEYRLKNTDGQIESFENFLWDVVVFEPTFSVTTEDDE